jgi:ribosome-associated toxin RatA of RatAB toxin-antitoxin module
MLFWGGKWNLNDYYKFEIGCVSCQVTETFHIHVDREKIKSQQKERKVHCPLLIPQTTWTIQPKVGGFTCSVKFCITFPT